ncbi:hypothetical protein IW261DRAFT_461498 [Armillaria novae-zelandiae]|uniref:Uncharacterized protein n=1 Tax=Armillaria novae-zelandiae TaxID=153914 RepID=A0AA39P1L6_9AGAR|nr:hypothetical protein IW261DRAFT_461498 [Armillaria novae-zelandiae]
MPFHCSIRAACLLGSRTTSAIVHASLFCVSIVLCTLFLNGFLRFSPITFPVIHLAPMNLPRFDGSLEFGEGQLSSSQDIYNHIITSPTIANALNIPVHDPSFVIKIKDPDSMMLRNDPYFLLLLGFLKDERVPVTSMELDGLNWLNFLDPSAFRLSLGPFFHIQKLELKSTTCSKFDMKCFITSLPKLTHLFLVGCKLQGEGGPLTGPFPEGPALDQISIDVLDGDYGVWDFLISPESPVVLGALTKIFITGDGMRVASDRTMVHRIQTLLDRTELTTEVFDISYINMGKVFIVELFNVLTSFQDEGLQPLDVENVKDLAFAITLTDVKDQMYRSVQWWTATFLALPFETHFEAVTIQVAVDQYRVEDGFVPPPDSRLILWQALDNALCRPDLHISRLLFFVNASTLNPESTYVSGYNYSGVTHWLCMHCLPRCTAKYETEVMVDGEWVDLPSP